MGEGDDIWKGGWVIPLYRLCINLWFVFSFKNSLIRLQCGCFVSALQGYLRLFLAMHNLIPVHKKFAREKKHYVCLICWTFRVREMTHPEKKVSTFFVASTRGFIFNRKCGHQWNQKNQIVILFQMIHSLNL